MPDEPKPDYMEKLKRWGIQISAIMAVAVVSALISRYIGVAAPILPPVPVEMKAPESNEPIQTFGWVDKPEAIAKAVADPGTVRFSATPAGQAVMGLDAPDTFLWRAWLKKNGGKLGNVNQRDVGCCVGCGAKHTADTSLACALENGERGEWKPFSVEVIYGGSRVEVGGGQISGDGSLGAWAAEFVTKFGVAPMQKYDSVDLTTFSPQRAREFGRSGVPADIEAVAKQHPVKSAALVTTWAECVKAIAQGYGIAVCSNQGFTMTRDAQGFARPQGQWPHCMAFIAIRGGARPGVFCLNSWGNDAHTGPTWPNDMPPAGFWVDKSVAERMLSQNDSYAYSGITGFPARKLDWFTSTTDPATIIPRRIRLIDDSDRFALAE